MTNKKVLLAEDDVDLGNIMTQYMELNGFNVTLARNGLEAWEKFQESKVDICILDVMMPDMDGFELARKISSDHSDIPFLFLTAKGLKEDRIKGLKLGADDYITKPFDIDELLLRIKNILRRKGSVESNSFTIGRFVFLFDDLSLTSTDEKFTLTMKEGMLLKYFLENQNRLIRREEILKELWGENDYFLGRSMDVFVSRIRKYLRSEKTISLDTVRGSGYIFRKK